MQLGGQQQDLQFAAAQAHEAEQQQAALALPRLRQRLRQRLRLRDAEPALWVSSAWVEDLCVAAKVVRVDEDMVVLVDEDRELMMHLMPLRLR